MALIADHHSPSFIGESRIKYLHADMVADLSGRERHEYGTSISIYYGMKFRVQPAFSAPDMAGNIPFLSKLEAVRCALR